MIAARWMPQNVVSLPAVGYFFVGFLTGRVYDDRGIWWNWPVAHPSGMVGVVWIVASLVVGALALGLPVRTVREPIRMAA